MLYIERILKSLNLASARVVRYSFLSSFCLRLPFSSSCLINLATEDHVLHEIGHHFYNTYYSTLIPKKEFRQVFGDPHKWYFGRWYFDKRVVEDLELERGFITTYAQVHSLEDFAECFVEAYKTLGLTCFYADRVLNRKIRVVKRWIKEAQSL